MSVQPLSASFYQRLITRLQQRLRAEGLQGILLLDMHNVIYLSGFFHSPSERPIGLFVPQADDPTLFIPLLERDNIDRLFLDDIRSYEEFPGLTHPVLWMLTEINRPHLAIDTLPAQLYTTIQKAFPGICLSDMVSEQRYCPNRDGYRTIKHDDRHQRRHRGAKHLSSAPRADSARHSALVATREVTHR